MVYIRNSKEVTGTRHRAWTRPKARTRKETYMQVRDPLLIKELRIERGLTQDQLAALCKCSQGAISAIETGKLDNISLDLGGYIAKWLERRPRELFDQYDDGELAARDLANSVRNTGRITRARKGAVAA